MVAKGVAAGVSYGAALVTGKPVTSSPPSDVSVTDPTNDVAEVITVPAPQRNLSSAASVDMLLSGQVRSPSPQGQSGWNDCRPGC